MQVSKEIAERYTLTHCWSSYYDLNAYDLFSGRENDPAVIAEIDSDHLCVGRDGVKRPYFVSVNVSPVNYEEVYLRDCLPGQAQKIVVQVFVFEEQEGRDMFEKDFNSI